MKTLLTKLIPALNALRTLLVYVFLGLPVLLCFGWLIPFMKVGDRDNYAFVVWFAVDVAICSIAHGTYRRSISGWVGQHQRRKRRYHYQAKVIDWLFKKIDGPNHCWRVYLQEKEKGFVRAR